MKSFPGWEQLDISSVTPLEIEKSWIATRSRIHRRERWRLWQRFVVAASLLTIILSPLAAWLWVSRHQASVPDLCQVSTRRGEVREVILPDGTKAVLNAESMLVYPESFVSERSVFLSGEASFDVTSDESHPFYVNTSDVTVKVHGTRFDLKAYYDEPIVEATLYRGVITAYPSGQEERSVTLQPNQCFSYFKTGGAITTASVNALESIAWENGNLCFRSSSVRDVIKTLERRYDVSIVLTSTKYDSTAITASFIHGETLDDLLGAICMIVPGMQFGRSGNTIILE